MTSTTLSPSSIQRIAPPQQADATKQDFYPATIARGGVTRDALLLRAIAQYRLSAAEIRELSDWGLAGLCKDYLIGRIKTTPFQIVGPDGRRDDISRYYEGLIRRANNSVQGGKTFIDRLADDVISTWKGGFYEVVRAEGGVPIALYNVDSDTIIPTWDVEFPYAQVQPLHQLMPTTGLNVVKTQHIPFRYDELPQLLWRGLAPTKDWYFNVPPAQLAYTGIAILAAGDEYNFDLLTEVTPSGLLNLGVNFQREQALRWKSDWDAAKEAHGGRRNDIGLLYGTEGVEWMPFRTPPKDMAYDSTAVWYGSFVAACHGLSLLDLGMGIEQTTTGVAAEAARSAARFFGVRRLISIIKESFEYYVLPEGYSMVYAATDPQEERAWATVNLMKAQSIRMLRDALGTRLALREAMRQGLLSADVTEAEIEEILAQIEMEQADRFQEKTSGKLAGQGQKMPDRGDVASPQRTEAMGTPAGVGN